MDASSEPDEIPGVPAPDERFGEPVDRGRATVDIRREIETLGLRPDVYRNAIVAVRGQLRNGSLTPEVGVDLIHQGIIRLQDTFCDPLLPASLHDEIASDIRSLWPGADRGLRAVLTGLAQDLGIDPSGFDRGGP